MKIINQTSAGGIVFKEIKDQKSTPIESGSIPIKSGSKIKDILWLICQHSQHKGWVFPKGLIGDKVNNEPMEQAALRETKEETGIEAKIVNNTAVKVSYEYVQTASAKASAVKVKKTVYYFLMKYVSGDTKDHDWEMSEAKFVTANEVKKTLTYKSDQEAFKKILRLVK